MDHDYGALIYKRMRSNFVRKEYRAWIALAPALFLGMTPWTDSTAGIFQWVLRKSMPQREDKQQKQ